MKMFEARLIVPATFFFILISACSSALAQLASQDRWDPPANVISLYPGAAPGSEDWNWSERIAGTYVNPQVQNVVHPELLYYPADKAMSVGTAMIVAPGGGFSTLMMTYEGVSVAKRLNQMGVDAFVLKYRLLHREPNVPFPPPSAATTSSTPRKPGELRPFLRGIAVIAGKDGQQAIRILRESASDYGFAPNRVGIIGFSAGGDVAVTTVRGPADTRPDFAAMIYAAGANGDLPPAGAPPIFLAVAADDHGVGYQGSLDMFSAWTQAGIPAELHIFQIGSHGFQKKGGGADHYLDRVEEWMRVNGFLGRGAAK